MIGYKISDLPGTPVVKGGMLLEVADLTEANAADQSRKLSIDMLRSYIVGSIPTNPEGVEWVTRPTVTVSGTTVSISTAEADFNGTPVSFSADTQTVTLPASGLLRQDVIGAMADGTYVYVEGPEAGTAISASLPNGALFVAYLLFSSQGGDVVEPAELPTDPTPVLLTDAATVTFNTDTGKIRENAALTLTGQLQTLVLSNTKAGYFYQVRLKNCTGQQVTLSPVSGVSYVGLDGQALTTVTLPASGDCMLSYYHASNTERVIELLDGSTGTGTGTGTGSVQMEVFDAQTNYPPNHPNIVLYPHGFQSYMLFRRSGTALIESPSTPGEYIDPVEDATHDYWQPLAERAVHTFPADGFGNFPANTLLEQDGLIVWQLVNTGYGGGTLRSFLETIPANFIVLRDPENVGGGTVTVDSALSGTSENPVQNKVVKTALDGKQATLVSGTNLKTVNGNSLLGAGDVVISGGGVTVSGTRSQSTSTAPTSKLLDDELTNLRPNGLTTFAATNTFDRNKVMKLGGTGDAFTANHVLNNAASGNLMDTTLTVLVTGNGTNTVSLEASWKNENGGAFDTTNGKKNVFRLHYLDSNNKFFTITQPA
jgi:hypothetical protein